MKGYCSKFEGIILFLEIKLKFLINLLIKMDFFLKEINLFKDDKYIKSS